MARRCLYWQDRLILSRLCVAGQGTWHSPDPESGPDVELRYCC